MCEKCVKKDPIRI